MPLMLCSRLPNDDQMLGVAPCPENFDCQVLMYGSACYVQHLRRKHIIVLRATVAGGGGVGAEKIPGYTIHCYFRRQPPGGGRGYKNSFLTRISKISMKRGGFKANGWFIAWKTNMISDKQCMLIF